MKKLKILAGYTGHQVELRAEKDEHSHFVEVSAGHGERRMCGELELSDAKRVRTWLNRWISQQEKKPKR